MVKHIASKGKGSNLVAVVEGYNELLEEPACQCLRQATPGIDELMQVASRHVLHDDCQVFGREEAFSEADDMGVTACPTHAIAAPAGHVPHEADYVRLSRSDQGLLTQGRTCLT